MRGNPTRNNNRIILASEIGTQISWPIGHLHAYQVGNPHPQKTKPPKEQVQAHETENMNLCGGDNEHPNV
jgi:hypothetical protein